MILIDDLKQKLKALEQVFADAAGALDVPKLKNRLSELDAVQQDPDFYKDIQRAQKVNSEAKYLSREIEKTEGLGQKISEIKDFIELIEEEGDEELTLSVLADIESAEEKVQELYLATLLKGEYDRNNAILTLHAGAGGTEAQDWVSMLYRMYRMYCEKAGFSLQELDKLDGDEAGIKSVTFLVKGTNAYGYLRTEMGVHRLVRISPFDSNARRHTSFASLEVMPELEDEGGIVIGPDDLKIDRYRSGGAGGQHVNKTDSAVRITHLPTGIVVQCQNERSQIQNRETAMKMLMGKLAEKKEREMREKSGEIKGDLKKIEWGSQIRSYVFQPYTMVKDHRTNFEKTDIAAVMNGDIEEFIYDYLKKSV